MTNTTTSTINQNAMIVVTGNSTFTEEEMNAIKAKMSQETEDYLGKLNSNFMYLDSAETELFLAIRRAQRDLRESKEYIRLQSLKQSLKAVQAQRNTIRTKALAIFESLLGGVRKNTSLYKKIMMFIAAGEES
jgi:hypothetical protein